MVKNCMHKIIVFALIFGILINSSLCASMPTHSTMEGKKNLVSSLFSHKEPGCSEVLEKIAGRVSHEEEMMVCAAAMLEKDDSVYPRVQMAERHNFMKKGKRNDE